MKRNSGTWSKKQVKRRRRREQGSRCWGEERRAGDRSTDESEVSSYKFIPLLTALDPTDNVSGSTDVVTNK